MSSEPQRKSKDQENAGQAGNCGGNGLEAPLLAPVYAVFLCLEKHESTRQSSDNK